MKSLNQATGKLIRFLHIYKSIVIGVLIFAGSAFMLYFTKDILVSSSSLTTVIRLRMTQPECVSARTALCMSTMAKTCCVKSVPMER